MKTIYLVLIASLVSMNSLFAQNTPIVIEPTVKVAQKDSVCSCPCRDVEYWQCRHHPFVSLKTDTVVGRLTFLTSLTYQPYRLRESVGTNLYRTQVPIYLNWNFLEGEAMLIRHLYLGAQIGMGIPFRGSFRETANTFMEVRMRPSFNMGLNLTQDLFSAKRFKIFLTVNGQFSFNFLRINRRNTSTANIAWLNFMQQNSGSKNIEYATLRDGMNTTDRDNITMSQFTMQAQVGLGADILLRPNGAALHFQVGYQFPVNGMTSAWRYGYQQNEDTQRQGFRIINAPFSYLQEGVYVKLAFGGLFNKTQSCTKKVRRDCDYSRPDNHHNGDNNNNNNNNNFPSNDTPRTPTPTPRTPR